MTPVADLRRREIPRESCARSRSTLNASKQIAPQAAGIRGTCPARRITFIASLFCARLALRTRNTDGPHTPECRLLLSSTPNRRIIVVWPKVRRRKPPMLTREENELVTRVGPGTPMGDVLRRYWIPALMSRELPEPDCPPVRVQAARREARRAFATARAASGSSTNFARTAAPRCGSGATRNPGCAASITAGNSTSTANASSR